MSIMEKHRYVRQRMRLVPDEGILFELNTNQREANENSAELVWS